MKKALLISLSLVLALVAWSTLCAEDNFYVVPAMKGNYAPVPKTGQMQSYTAGDDGNLHKGVASPTPRFTDNNNGTVTDNLTGLIWMQNANAFGLRTWDQAISDAATVGQGIGGVEDGSIPGNWRLPDIRELQSLIDYGQSNPALPANNHFLNVQMEYYWSSTTSSEHANCAWFVYLYDGFADFIDYKGEDYPNKQNNTYFVWCVRGGR